MMRQNSLSYSVDPNLRRGIILPLLAIMIVVMVGFLALAIDLGMLAIAKTQVQQAADLAALTAMRTLNGNSSINYNQTAATTNAQNVVTYNTILGTSLQSSALQLTFGSYDYNQTAGTFQANFPPTTGSPDYRNINDSHIKQSSGRVQQDIADAIPAGRFGDSPGSTPPARYRARYGPVRLDAHGHLSWIRLLYELAHFQ